MSTIQLPGLQTGIDTQALISQLIAAQSGTLITMENRKSRWEEKQTALSDIESKISSLRTRIRSVSDADVLKAFSVSSSDSDILTAEATNDAFEGNHSVEISQLATRGITKIPAPVPTFTIPLIIPRLLTNHLAVVDRRATLPLPPARPTITL